MKTPKIIVLFAAALAAFSLVGCATPASRIRKNPELFANYAPEQQTLIMQGKVAVGFDKDAVRLALGAPDHVRTRVTNDGASQIWSYVTYEAPDGMPLYRGWYHRYYAWRDPLYPWYDGYPDRREREHFRVVFDRTGHVSTIEQEVA